MGKLKTYDVVIDGNRTSMKLTEEDAKRLGATETKKATAPSTKKRTSKNKAADTEGG